MEIEEQCPTNEDDQSKNGLIVPVLCLIKIFKYLNWRLRTPLESVCRCWYQWMPYDDVTELHVPISDHSPFRGLEAAKCLETALTKLVYKKKARICSLRVSKYDCELSVEALEIICSQNPLTLKCLDLGNAVYPPQLLSVASRFKSLVELKIAHIPTKSVDSRSRLEDLDVLGAEAVRNLPNLKTVRCSANIANALVCPVTWLEVIGSTNADCRYDSKTLLLHKNSLIFLSVEGVKFVASDMDAESDDDDDILPGHFVNLNTMNLQFTSGIFPFSFKRLPVLKSLKLISLKQFENTINWCHLRSLSSLVNVHLECSEQPPRSTDLAGLIESSCLKEFHYSQTALPVQIDSSLVVHIGAYCHTLEIFMFDDVSNPDIPFEYLPLLVTMLQNLECLVLRWAKVPASHFSCLANAAPNLGRIRLRQVLDENGSEFDELKVELQGKDPTFLRRKKSQIMLSFAVGYFNVISLECILREFHLPVTIC